VLRHCPFSEQIRIQFSVSITTKNIFRGFLLLQLSIAKQIFVKLLSWQFDVPLCAVIPKKRFCRMFPFALLCSKLPAIPLAEEMPIQPLARECEEEGVQPRFRYQSVLDICPKTRGSEEVRGHQNTCV
jgi:hypothetical protein